MTKTTHAARLAEIAKANRARLAARAEQLNRLAMLRGLKRLQPPTTDFTPRTAEDAARRVAELTESGFDAHAVPSTLRPGAFFVTFRIR